MLKSTLFAIAALVSIVAGATVPDEKSRADQARAKAEKDPKTQKLTIGPNGNTTDVSERDAEYITVFMTQGYNWSGNSMLLTLPLYYCAAMNDIGWNDIPSSFGPPEGYTCRLYSAIGCKYNDPNRVDLAYPGSSDLRSVWGHNLDKQLSSIYCRPSWQAFDCDYCPLYQSFCLIVQCQDCWGCSNCGSCTIHNW
ncbi:hypothetical protein TWF718_000474 [Orbilia javanica]|uniref:Uncharacterized protein n=1 Tax=Orbilia javanica TaxID=47235 RepID=A0AAN8RFX6_9PEZI